jgi:hypothetical protein
MLHRLLAVLALAAFASSAQAEYYFEFASGTTVSNTFTVNQGSTININVYLAQDGTTSTGLTQYGLNSAGVALNIQNPAITTVTAVTPNSQFGYASTTTGANPSVSEYITSSQGVTPSTVSNAVLLGTFTFSGVSAGTTATITALPGQNPDNVLNDGTNGNPGTAIDSMIANASAVITVAAVPEPGTLVLTGLVAVGVAGAYLRRRGAVIA